MIFFHLRFEPLITQFNVTTAKATPSHCFKGKADGLHEYFLALLASPGAQWLEMNQITQSVSI